MTESITIILVIVFTVIILRNPTISVENPTIIEYIIWVFSAVFVMGGLTGVLVENSITGRIISMTVVFVGYISVVIIWKRKDKKNKTKKEDNDSTTKYKR